MNEIIISHYYYYYFEEVVVMNNNQKNAENTNLLAKNVDIEPTGVIYNLRTSMIEEFVEDYLTRQNVDGIAAVEVAVEEGGKSNPYVSIYLFLKPDCKQIISDIDKVPSMLRNKVDKINVRLSDGLKKILSPLTGPEFKSGKIQSREYFVQLNIFRVIGLMFAAQPNKHKLVISDAKNIPSARDAIISVVKSEKTLYNNTPNNKYRRAVEQLEKR